MIPHTVKVTISKDGKITQHQCTSKEDATEEIKRQKHFKTEQKSQKQDSKGEI